MKLKLKAEVMRYHMRHRRSVWAALAAAGLTLCVAVPAEAAKKAKHVKAKHAASAAVHAGRHSRAAVAAPGYFQGGVPGGPLYNGQDYLGDDPDPNIRSFLIRDKSRYGGVD